MLLSCSSSSDGDGEVTISCSPTSIDVPAKGGTYKIMIVASEGGWEARASLPGEEPTANVYPKKKMKARGNKKETKKIKLINLKITKHKKKKNKEN